MYSPAIVERRIDNVQQQLGIELTEYPIPYVRKAVSHLALLVDKKGDLKRPLDREETEFIQNERLMSKCSFSYWSERYAHIRVGKGEGGIQLFKPWKSQELLFRRLAKTEEAMWAARAEGQTQFDAYCFFIHKARQLGFSSGIQLLGVHATNFYGNLRGMTASMDDEKTQKIHTDYYCLPRDRMPWWMKTSELSRIKSRGMVFGNESSMILQDASQEGGLAQGSQIDWSHLTECASWPDPATAIENHYFPTISSTIRSMAFLESTAQGMADWWHEATDQARKGEKDRWQYFFVPWYAVEEKWMRVPPVTWEPSQMVLDHAKEVFETSAEFLEGHQVELTREQMFFYEDQYKSYKRLGTLNLFFANWCASPEESFQHSGVSAFDVETLQKLRTLCRGAVPYEILTPETNRDRIINHDPGDLKSPKHYTVGEHTIVPVMLDEVAAADPRGLILMWERPSPRQIYKVAVDPTVGIPGWTRTFRRADDKGTDNGAIIVGRKGFRGAPDVQVAEYAAPIDPQTLADPCAILGRLFRGTDEEEAEMIIEIYPGPGGQTQQKLVNYYNYINFYQWKQFDGIQVKPTQIWGWHSNVKSVRELWILGKHHVSNNHFVPRSKYLVSEFSWCEFDPIKMRGQAMAGRHDDRAVAALLLLWALHDWTVTFHQPQVPAREGSHLDQTPAKWHEMDASANEIAEMEEEWLQGILDEEDY